MELGCICGEQKEGEQKEGEQKEEGQKGRPAAIS